jgi:hypothetical protein
MGRQPLGPPQLPDGFWSRGDVLQALRDRDFGELFRLVARYAGASQTQIAIAVGMTQGQVSTIAAGDRRVTAIDVAERTLDGLNAPDPARLAFGLAPRDSSPLPSAFLPAVPSLQMRDTGRSGELAAGGDMDRREVLRFGGATALGAVAAPMTGPSFRLVEISRALTSYDAWDRAEPTGAPLPAIGQLAAAVARAKRDYQACRYASVLNVLPRLLETVRWACRVVSGDELLRVQALAADAYQVTGSVMLKLGDVALATLAADRSIEAATRSEDPLALAASARIVVHSMLSGGHTERAMEIAAKAAQRLSADVAKPGDEALSVYGALMLRGGIAAARSDHRQDAIQMLDEAGDAAARLGRDDNAHWTAFGPTNVMQHRVHVAMLLGDAGTAVDLARRIDVSRIELAERKTALFIDTARAYAQWGKYEQTYHALVAAEQVAPEEVRTHREVSRLVADLVTRGSQGVRSRGREFAQLVGVEL